MSGCLLPPTLPLHPARRRVSCLLLDGCHFQSCVCLPTCRIAAHGRKLNKSNILKVNVAEAW